MAPPVLGLLYCLESAAEVSARAFAAAFSAGSAAVAVVTVSEFFSWPRRCLMSSLTKDEWFVKYGILDTQLLAYQGR